MKKRKTSITQLTRELRRNPTEAERTLWAHLRKRQLGGYRFVRQKPFVYQHRNNRSYFYVADFYCAEQKLIIELDGKIHDYQQYYDYRRDLVLQGLGLQTLRINNDELADMEQVKRKICSCLE